MMSWLNFCYGHPQWALIINKNPIRCFYYGWSKWYSINSKNRIEDSFLLFFLTTKRRKTHLVDVYKICLIFFEHDATVLVVIFEFLPFQRKSQVFSAIFEL